MFLFKCLHLQEQGWSSVVFGISPPWHRAPKPSCLSHLFPRHIPHFQTLKILFSTRFYLIFFPTENVLLPALPRWAAGMFGRHHQDPRASSLWSDINQYLFFGIKTSSTPPGATLQHCLYTAFILHFCWGLFISSKSCGDARGTFVWSRGLSFILKEGKAECVWKRRMWQKMLKCNCWVPSCDATRKWFCCCWTAQHSFYKIPIFS